MSSRTARWLPGGHVGWSPQSRGIPVGGLDTPKESPFFSSGLDYRLGQSPEAATRWGAINVRMGVGRRGGKDHPSLPSRGSISATRFIGKDCLTLKTSAGWVKCRRAHKPSPIAGQTAQPRDAPLSTQNHGGGGTALTPVKIVAFHLPSTQTAQSTGSGVRLMGVLILP